MPGINLVAPYANLVFDSSVKDKSDIFALGGPVMTIHVTANEPGDTGTIALQGTNVPYKQGASDEYMGWQTLGFCSVGSVPKTIATYFAYGRFSYTGKGRLSSAYSDAALSTGGTSGGSGTDVQFGTVGLQLAQSNTPADASLVLQLGTASKLSSGATGTLLVQSATAQAARTALELGSAALLTTGTYGASVVQMQTAQALKDSLELGTASTLTYGAKGAEIVQAQSAQDVKNSLGLSALASVTPTAHGTDLVTSSNPEQSRSLLQLGTASILNNGQTGKDLIEASTPASARNALEIQFGQTSTTYARGDHAHTDYMPISGGSFTGAVGTNVIPSQATDLVNKQYVDTLLSGFKYKEPVKVATTALISLSGLQVIDGVSLVAGNRVLVKNQTTQEHNGIWVVSAGTWARAADFDTWSEIPGAMVIVESGTTHADTGWICTSNSGGTLNSTPITFVQNFTAAGTFIQGAGINIAGNVISLASSGITAGTWTKPTFDTYGRAISGQNLTSSDLTNTLGYTPIQQGTGLGQNTSVVKIGEASSLDGLKATVNGSDAGYFVMSGNPSLGRTRLGLGTSATKNTPASGNAADTEIVIGSDTRLKAYAVGEAGVLITDWNTALGSGIVRSAPSETSNAPNTANWFIGDVRWAGDGWAIQTAIEFAGTNVNDSRTWQRYLVNGTFTAWTRVRLLQTEQSALWSSISHTHSYLPLTGGTLTGALTLSGDPTSALHSATKQYVDARMTYSQPSYIVRAASTTNNVRSGLITIDDVSLNAGDLVLIRTAANAGENGIYVVSSGTWTRATDADTWDKLASKPVTVLEGTISGGSTYTNNARAGSGTLGTTSIIYTMVGKKYTDDAIKLLYIRRPVVVATTANITLSGGQTIDGIVLNTGDRVLVKNQTNATQNGVYTVSLITAWSRAEDCSTWDTLVGIGIYVAAGTVNAGTTWHNTNYGSGTLGTTNITFTNDNVILNSSDITTALGYTPTTQSYVDTEFLDSSNKQMCHCATTANITLSGIQTIDDQATAAGQRVLVKNQTNAGENGIYVVSSGTWTRATDADTLNRLVGASVSVARGTINGMSSFVSNTTVSGGTLGVTPVTFKAAIPTKVSELGLTEAYFNVKLGYGPGAGGQVTQATSKSTNVTLDKLCGTIVMNNAALAAGATVSFTLNNTYIHSGSFVLVHHYYAGTLGAYRVDTHTTATGSVVIRVKNESASSLSEIVQLRFLVMHGTAS